MASASSPNPKSCSPELLPNNRRPPALLAASLAAVVFLTIELAPRFGPSTKSVFAVGMLCAAWWIHLEGSSLPRLWSSSLVVLIASSLILVLLRTPTSLASKASAVAAGLCVYLAVWAFSLLHSPRALQAVATVAMLFSLVSLARPAVMVFAALFCLIFWLNCGRRFGGRMAAGLLVFTPALLVLGVSILLQTLGIALLENPVPRLDLYGLVGQHHFLYDCDRLRPLLPALLLVVGVLSARLAEGRSTIVDFTWSGLLVCLLGGVLLGPESSKPLTLLDLSVIAYGGAMALLSASSFGKFPLRLLVSSAACGSLAINVIR